MKRTQYANGSVFRTWKDVVKYIEDYDARIAEETLRNTVDTKQEIK